MMCRMLTVVRGGGTAPSEIATGTFTGEAWRDVLIGPTDGSAVGNVFLCRARALLAFVRRVGSCWSSSRAKVMSPTTAAWSRCARATWSGHHRGRHWHGASTSRYLIHTAITVGDTNWEQAVSERTTGANDRPTADGSPPFRSPVRGLRHVSDTGPRRGHRYGPRWPSLIESDARRAPGSADRRARW